MGKMPYLFFTFFTFLKLNPPGWLCLMFIVLTMIDLGMTVHKHNR